MALVFILVFVAVFSIIAPVFFIAAGGTGGRSKKQTLAALDSALGTSSAKRRTPVLNFRKNELASAIPWLNRRLEKLATGPSLKRLLRQADLKWTPGLLILVSLVSCFIPAYAVDLRTGSVFLALLAGVATGFIPLGFVYFKRGKRFERFEQGLPEALDLMVSALRVGHGFSAAMGLVTRECADPVAGEFRVAFDEQNFGLDLRHALENLLSRVPLQDLRIAVTAILIQRESGGNLAEVLEKTAHVIRQRFRLKKQVMVHTAQGRLTGWILTILPLALGFGLYIVNPETMSLLWRREIGVKMLIGAGGMLVIGTLLIQKIVRMDV